MCFQGQKVPGGPSVKAMTPSAGPSGRGPHMNRNFPVGLVSFEPSEALHINPLINRKVMSRWPEDNSFYEATITDYNPETVCSYFIIATVLLIQAFGLF